MYGLLFRISKINQLKCSGKTSLHQTIEGKFSKSENGQSNIWQKKIHELEAQLKTAFRISGKQLRKRTT